MTNREYRAAAKGALYAMAENWEQQEDVRQFAVDHIRRYAEETWGEPVAVNVGRSSYVITDDGHYVSEDGCVRATKGSPLYEAIIFVKSLQRVRQ